MCAAVPVDIVVVPLAGWDAVEAAVSAGRFWIIKFAFDGLYIDCNSSTVYCVNRGSDTNTCNNKSADKNDRMHDRSHNRWHGPHQQTCITDDVYFNITEEI